MAGENRVPYIIDIEASFEKFRQQMKSGEFLNKGDIKAFQSLLTKVFKQMNAEASRIGINLQKGLNVDTSNLENEMKFISGLFDEMGKSKNPISDWAEKGKSVYQQFTNLQTSVASLAQSVGTVQTGLNNLTSSFNAFKNAYQSFDPSKFTQIPIQMDNAAKAGEKAISTYARLDKILQGQGGLEKQRENLQSLYDILASDAKVPDFSNMSVDQLLEQFYKLDDELDKIDKKVNWGNLSEQQLAQYAAIEAQLVAIDELLPSNKKQLIKVEYNGMQFGSSPEDYKADIQEAITAINQAIDKLDSEIKSKIGETLTQEISKQLSEIQLKLTLPEDKTLFINEINKYVADVNKAPLEKVKIELMPALNDSANIIEDKTKRTYGENSADDDVNTTELLNKTEKRFNAIYDKINDKQQKILELTKDWRIKMLEQFKFSKGDFIIEFNDTLVEQLQSLFDDYALEVHINTETLANEIKTVLNGSNISLGGGTANIDVNSIASAVTTGLRAVLFGEKIQTPQENVLVDNNNNNNIVSSEENLSVSADKIEKTAKHLDLAEDYVKDVVEKLKAVAKYAMRDGKGATATREKFNLLGVDLKEVNSAENDAKIVSIIEEAFLQRDKFGNFIGNTIGSELVGFKGSSSKTIPEFINSINEMFFMLQEDTQTVEEWVNRNNNKEILEFARTIAKAAKGLKDIRKTVKNGEIPSQQLINDTITLMSNAHQDTSALDELLVARDTLADKTDDESINEFKKSADLFWKNTSKLFHNLNEQANKAFDGVVFFQGENGRKYNKHIKTSKDLANIKDDAVIVNVEVYSSLNDVAIGTVDSKYKKNHTSDAREKQLMKNASKPDYIVSKKEEGDILNKELTYKGFKIKEQTIGEVDIDNALEGNVRRKQSLTEEIKKKEQEKRDLDAQISELEEEINSSERKFGITGQSTYKSHITKDYNQKNKKLDELNKQSNAQTMYDIPKEERTAEMTAANDEFFKLISRRKITEREIDRLQTLTVEQAKKNLQGLNKRSKLPEKDLPEFDSVNSLFDRMVEITNEREKITKKLKDNTISDDERATLNERKNILGEDLQNLNRVVYKKFLNDPKGLKEEIYKAQRETQQEIDVAQQAQYERVSNWAKGRKPQVLSAEAEVKKSAEDILTTISTTMKSIYEDMVNTQNKLKGNISDDEKAQLSEHMRSLIRTFNEAQAEYNDVANRHEITRKPPLSKKDFNKVSSLESKYLDPMSKQTNESKENLYSYELTQQQLDSEIIMLKKKEEETSSKIAEAKNERLSWEEKLANVSESDVELEKNRINQQIKSLEKEKPGLNSRLEKAKKNLTKIESEKSLAQADVYKKSAALKKIPDNKKNKQARLEAEDELNKAKNRFTDLTVKYNDAVKEVNDAENAIKSNETSISKWNSKLSSVSLENIRQEQINRIDSINNLISDLEDRLQQISKQKSAKENTKKKIDEEIEKIKKTDDVLKTSTEYESNVSERNRLINQRTAVEDTLNANKSEIESLNSSDKRLIAIKEYNSLQEESAMLQGEINKMIEDGADNASLQKKNNKLEEINKKLVEQKSLVESLGGFYEGNGREYSDNDRKKYALEEIKKIDNDLIIAKAQKRVAESRTKKKARQIDEIDKWGLSAGYGASELSKAKIRLTEEFKNSDYMKLFNELFSLKGQMEEIQSKYIQAEDEYYSAKNKQWDESLSASERETWANTAKNASDKLFTIESEFSETKNKLAAASKLLTGENILAKLSQLDNAKNAEINKLLGDRSNDKNAVRDFLYNDKNGKRIASKYEQEEKAIWDEYFTLLRQAQKDEIERFKSSFKTKKGILTATGKTQDENGNWVDDIIEKRVKEEVAARLKEEKRILEERQAPIQDNIDRLEADKNAAIQYGGVSEAELLSADIVNDQINKEVRLAEEKEKQIKAQERLNELEAANVDHKSDEYKAAKKELNDANKAVEQYEYLIKNRQKLIQIRYDESQEPTYTDEEKRLLYTNKIVTYNEKINESLERQKELEKQIGVATGDEKKQLQYKLEKEQEKVDEWKNIKIPKFQRKLDKLPKYSSASSGGELPNGGIVGSIFTAIKEASGSFGGQVDTTELAKEATLSAILELLGGVPQVIGDNDNYGLGRPKDDVVVPENTTTEASASGKHTVNAAYSIKKAIKIVEDALSESTSKKTSDMSKIYANKIRKSSKAREAADRLLDTPDEELTKKQKSIKYKLQGHKTAYEATHKPKALKQEQQPEEVDIKSFISDAIDQYVEQLSGDIQFDKNKLKDAALNKFKDADISSIVEDLTSFLIEESKTLITAEVKKNIIASDVADKKVKPNKQRTKKPKETKDSIVKKAEKTDKTSTTSSKPTEKVEVKDFNDFKSQIRELAKLIGQEEAGSEEQRNLQMKFIETLQVWAKNKNSDLSASSNAKDREKYLVDKKVLDKVDTNLTPLTNNQFKKMKPVEIAQKPIENKNPERQQAEKSDTLPQNNKTTAVVPSGGLIGLIGQLAKQDTLIQILNALRTLGTTEGGATAPTPVGNLYEQFKGLLFGSSIDDHERLAYMNSKEGLISGSVIGNIANISEELIQALRIKYPTIEGFDTQIHTHGKSTNPYFSKEDYQHFTKDYEDGINKQILLTQDSISLLDLSAVKSAEEVKALMDELIKAGNDAKAIGDIFNNSKSGAIFETTKFDTTNANSILKMIGMSNSGSMDKTGSINSLVKNLKSMRDEINQPIEIGYLSESDSNLIEFDNILKSIDKINEAIKNGTTSYEDQEAELTNLLNSAERYYDVINSTISKNKRAYVGVGEVDSVNKQRNKIIGVFGSEEAFNNSDIAMVQNYNDAVNKLNETYKDLTKTQQIQNESTRNNLQQQASQVNAMGKRLAASLSEADRLKQLSEESGTYLDSFGNAHDLGGSKNNLSAKEVENLNRTMRNYVQNTLKQANIENVKFNGTKKQLTYTFRTSKDAVADMVVQYNDATNALYAYNKQERESLTGMKAFVQATKSKLRSIVQYIASITSIYRVFGELKQGVQYIKEIDSALTELKKVTDETEETYSKFLDTASKTASKVGSTIKDVVSSTADWARLGYSIQEAAQLAESTQILMNVSEFTDISTATDSLISSIQAFKYTAEESMDVVDILNTIGKQICRGYIVIYNRAVAQNGETPEKDNPVGKICEINKM